MDLNSEEYKNLPKDREKYKKWFQNNKIMLDDIDVLEFWKRDNASEYSKFVETFVNRYNIVASRANLPKIK